MWFFLFTSFSEIMLIDDSLDDIAHLYDKNVRNNTALCVM